MNDNYDVPVFSCAGCGWYFSGRNSEELWGVLMPHLDNDHDGRSIGGWLR